MKFTASQEARTMTSTTQIVEALRSDYPHVNETLVNAVLAGTAMVATTGAGVTPALRDRILAAAGHSHVWSSIRWNRADGVRSCECGTVERG